MLKQIDIFTQKNDISNLWSDLSVKIHGYIMSQIDTSFAEELHSGGAMPFSIYTVVTEDGYITRVSALNEKAMAILDVFKEKEKIRVFGCNYNLKILNVSEGPLITVEQLVSYVSANKYRFTIATPAMYKSKGEICCLPDLSRYFESIRIKLEKFENIVITKEQSEMAFESLKILDYHLTTKALISGGKKCPGLLGEYCIHIPQMGEESKILRLLLSYATYSGIGGQTTQGMGGVLLERWK